MNSWPRQRSAAPPPSTPAAPAGWARPTAKWAVVDDQLRVHGLQGLRVIDASIMPRMISANLNASTMMIADKASDLIRGKSATTAERRSVDSRLAACTHIGAFETGRRTLFIGHAVMSELSLLSEVERKSHSIAGRTVFDPKQTLNL